MRAVGTIRRSLALVLLCSPVAGCEEILGDLGVGAPDADSTFSDVTTSDGAPPGMACVPGRSLTCAGPGGCVGAQTCDPPGATYGACVCGTPDAGDATVEADAPSAEAMDAPSEDAPADGPIDASSQDAPGPDGAPGDAADSAPDIGPDTAPTCVDACGPVGESRCEGTTVETCTSQNGCAAWVATTTCSADQSCTSGSAGTASCTCNATECAGVGTTCQDRQTIATCQKDANGCLYVSGTEVCSATDSCVSGDGGASCSPNCMNTCSPSQTQCVNGALSTCVLSPTTGCYGYGPATPCGGHQTCTGPAGAAACTCNADPVCSSSAPACASSSALAQCAQDPQGCFYEVSSASCMSGAQCSGGTCACPAQTQVCNGACADLRSDSNNCGGCGLACPTGCAGGRCLVTLASGPMGAPIAIDSTSLYWVSLSGGAPPTPGIQVFSLTGGGMSTLVPATTGLNDIATVSTLAVDSTSVYYSLNSEGISNIFRVAKDGSGSRNLEGAGTITSMALTNLAIYAASGPDLFPNTAGIYTAPLNDPDAGKPVRFSPNCGQGAIAIDTVNIYCTDATGILKLPLVGGAPITLAAGQTLATAIAVNATTVYWLNAGTSANNFTDGSVMAIPIVGGTPQTLAAGQSIGPGASMTIDGQSVYWTSGLSPEPITKVPLAGGATTTLATGQGGPGGIAVDATSAYWSTGSALMKLTPK